MGSTLRLAGEQATDEHVPQNAALDLHELTASLIEAQRARVFKALHEERTSGRGLDPATSVELKRLMSMIVASSQLGRSTAPQDRARESSTGPVSAVLAALIQKPRKTAL